MAKRKSKPQKQTTGTKRSSWVLKHTGLTGVLIILVVVLSFIGYNKYLDYKNVQDMKTLVTKFQQVEKEIEAKTSEELYIQKDCAYSGEKFEQKITCDLVLVPTKESSNTDFTKLLIDSRLDKEDGCRIAKSGLYKNYIFCDLTYRPSTKNEVNNLVK